MTALLEPAQQRCQGPLRSSCKAPQRAALKLFLAAGGLMQIHHLPAPDQAAGMPNCVGTSRYCAPIRQT
jgi:hypothetical protein